MDWLISRIKNLNQKPVSREGKFFLYWMDCSQRENFNHALEYSIHMANEYKKPLVVYFPITDKYKFSNLRHYTFMMEGILKTKIAVEGRGIKFIIEKVEDPALAVIKHSKNVCAVITDRGYLKHQRAQREKVAFHSEVAVFQVEGDVVVPVEVVSDHQEPYARTIRGKIYSKIGLFLKVPPKIEPKVKSFGMDFGFEEMNYSSVQDYLNLLNIRKDVKPVSKYFEGGYDQAIKRLRDFIENKLSYYKEYRSDPSKDYQSDLSPYLRFGQISPVEVVLEVLKAYPLNDPNVESFFNELIVWRELARNYAFYNPYYSSYEGIPDWAKQSLQEHEKDEREAIYSLEDLEQAKTDDPYWNTAQKELLLKGKMHNYMRMYWCKRLIEWTKSPKEAFDIACYLNDKYELDGRDPNGYAGIAWCFGSFDRPFQERKVLGKIRPMSPAGLERKFDMKAYLQRVSNL
ncbi:deoxyribodipyrimidine photo-lyase [Thermocrinis sp.]